MSFNLLPIVEVAHSTDSNSPHQAGNKVLDFAHITDEHFMLLLLLTSRELVIHTRSLGSSRLESVPIARLFPQKALCEPALVSLTSDASVVIVLLADALRILLIPFRSLMDVTWARKGSQLANRPTMFAFDDERTEANAERTTARPTASLCFHSQAIAHTFLLIGNEAGSLCIIDLNMRRLSVQIDLHAGIRALQLCPDNGHETNLLISQLDGSQLLLPLENDDIPLREMLARLPPSKIRPLSDHLHFFPQPGSVVCALNTRANTLCVLDSFSPCSNTRLARPLFQMANLPDQIEQLLLSQRMVVALDRRNRLFVHLRFLQPERDFNDFMPIEVSQAPQTHLGQLGGCGRILSLVSPSDASPIFPVTNGTGKPLFGDQLDCFVVSEAGLFWLRSQQPLYGLVLSHMERQLFNEESLTSAAQCLRTTPSQLCLVLLRHSLRHHVPLPAVVSDEETAQIDALLSLSFAQKVEPGSLLSLLKESGQEDLLLPFLHAKCDRHPSDASIRQLLFGAMIGRLSRVVEGKEAAMETETEQDDPQEREALELEIRQFLLKFDVNETEVLAVLMRYSLWSCVCVLLCRDSQGHSPTVARRLLELPNWKGVRNMGTLLKCLSFFHWPSVDSFAPVIVAKLFNLVPTLNVAELKIVKSISATLEQRSIDSAQSLHLVTAMRLFQLAGKGRSMQQETPSKRHPNRLSSGPNCTVLLAEDDYSTPETGQEAGDCWMGARILFWGEFSAGTLRLIKSEQKKAGEQRQSKSGELLSGLLSAKRRREDMDSVEKGEEDTKRATGRIGMKNEARTAFASAPLPRAISLPDNRLQICSAACGTEHVLFLTVDGRVLALGKNRFGQCGSGTSSSDVTSLKEICGRFGRVVSIHAGHYHSALVDEQNEVYLWGWGVHGQLGLGTVADALVPTKCNEFSALGGEIKDICLGYSHSLLLCEDGRVFGCGALAYGQLGIDPRRLDGDPLKLTRPVRLPFPRPISLLASAYFHGVALATDGCTLFEWGESPQSVKMRMFLQKRLRAKEKNSGVAEQQKEGEHIEKTANGEAKSKIGQSASTIADTPRDHLRIRRLCEWKGAAVRQLSAGFNHSALLTEDGELFTWGKSLEMQLGHRGRKERAQPTKVEEPRSVKWAEVVCARNFTTAISTEGLLFVWGRNDKHQLGLGTAAKASAGHIRKIALKSERGTVQKSVELPADNCVEAPTMLIGVRAISRWGAESGFPDENQLVSALAKASQPSLCALSRFLAKNPVSAFVGVQTHLMAGELLLAIRTLEEIVKREKLLTPQNEEQASKREDNARVVSVIVDTGKPKPEGTAAQGPVLKVVRSGSSSSPSPGASSSSVSSQHSTPISPSKRVVAAKLRTLHLCSSPPNQSSWQQTNSRSIKQPHKSDGDISPASGTPTPSTSSSPKSQPTSSSASCLEQFHTLVDKIWLLLRAHPVREIQTVALVELLAAHFPIYNRLAADVRLCRLVEPFLQISSVGSNSSSSTASSTAGLSSRRRLLELGFRERQFALRKAPPPDIEGRQFRALKIRCERMLAQDRYRYAADCGHWERCVLESGPARSELATLRNNLRLCTNCFENSRRRSGE